jgi:hypothetical protein
MITILLVVEIIYNVLFLMSCSIRKIAVVSYFMFKLTMQLAIPVTLVLADETCDSSGEFYRQ